MSRWTGRAVINGKEDELINVLARTPEVNRLFERHRSKWGDNIKTGVGETE
jgi:hypothetical protein